MVKSVKRHTQVVNGQARNLGVEPSPVNTYKLPPEEINHIFENVKPQRFTSFSRTWPRRKKKEEDTLDPAWKFDSADFNEELQNEEISEEEL